MRDGEDLCSDSAVQIWSEQVSRHYFNVVVKEKFGFPCLFAYLLFGSIINFNMENKKL